MTAERLDMSVREEAPPALPEAGIEKLLAEMFAQSRARRAAAARPAVAPVSAERRFARDKAPFAPAPPVSAMRTVAPEPRPFGDDASAVEPLRMPGSRRLARIFIALLLLAVALGGGWLAGWDGGARVASVIESLTSVATLNSRQGVTPAVTRPPVISGAPRPASRTAAPELSAPAASAPPPSAAPRPAPVAFPAAPSTQTSPAPGAAPRPIALAAPPDSAGVLGAPQPAPFDTAAAPRTVRTTAVIPPAPLPETPARPLDFADPSTWPQGAAKAEPHPLPPRRP